MWRCSQTPPIWDYNRGHGNVETTHVWADKTRIDYASNVLGKVYTDAEREAGIQELATWNS